MQPFAFVQEQTIHYLRYELFNSLTANICVIVIPNVVRHKTVMPISKHNNSFVITVMNKFFLLYKRLQLIQTIRRIHKPVFKVLFPTELIHELVELTTLVKEFLCLLAHLTDFYINLIGIIVSIHVLLTSVFLFEILHDGVPRIRSRRCSFAQAVSVNIEVKRLNDVLPVEIIGRFLDLNRNQPQTILIITFIFMLCIFRVHTRTTHQRRLAVCVSITLDCRYSLSARISLGSSTQ